VGTRKRDLWSRFVALSSLGGMGGDKAPKSGGLSPMDMFLKIRESDSLIS